MEAKLLDQRNTSLKSRQFNLQAFFAPERSAARTKPRGGRPRQTATYIHTPPRKRSSPRARARIIYTFPPCTHKNRLPSSTSPQHTSERDRENNTLRAQSRKTRERALSFFTSPPRDSHTRRALSLSFLPPKSVLAAKYTHTHTAFNYPGVQRERAAASRVYNSQLAR